MYIFQALFFIQLLSILINTVILKSKGLAAMKQSLKSNRFIEMLCLILFVLLFSINTEAKERESLDDESKQFVFD